MTFKGNPFRLATSLGKFGMTLRWFKNCFVSAAAKVFTTPVTNPAWKLKPSWYVVAKADRTINADLERMYAERAHSHKVEAEGASHAVYISRAKEVAVLIEEAANQARVAAK